MWRGESGGWRGGGRRHREILPDPDCRDGEVQSHGGRAAGGRGEDARDVAGSCGSPRPRGTPDQRCMKVAPTESRAAVLTGRLLMVAALAFVVRQIALILGSLPPVTIGLRSATVVAGGILWCAMSVGVQAAVWDILLASGGTPLPFRRAFAVVAKANVAKYLPGNVFQYVARFALARRAGVPAPVVVASTLAETALAVTAAAGVAIVGLVAHADWKLAGVLQTGAVRFLGAVVAVAFLIGCVLLWPRGREWLTTVRAHLRPWPVAATLALFLAALLGYGLLSAAIVEDLFLQQTSLGGAAFAGGWELAGLARVPGPRALPAGGAGGAARRPPGAGGRLAGRGRGRGERGVIRVRLASTSYPGPVGNPPSSLARGSNPGPPRLDRRQLQRSCSIWN